MAVSVVCVTPEFTGRRIVEAGDISISPSVDTDLQNARTRHRKQLLEHITVTWAI